MLTDEQKELCRRLREDLEVTDGDAIAAADLIELLAAHSVGAQEPVAEGEFSKDYDLGYQMGFRIGWKTGFAFGAGKVTLEEAPDEPTNYVSAQPQPMPQTDAARDALAKAVARYDELTGSIQGCTDGGCLIRKPEGMHTNGGCRCTRDHVKMQRAMYAAGKLRKALAEIERIERAKGE